MEQLSK